MSIVAIQAERWGAEGRKGTGEATKGVTGFTWPIATVGPHVMETVRIANVSVVLESVGSHRRQGLTALERAGRQR
jgi:hypothetical protein